MKKQFLIYIFTLLVIAACSSETSEPKGTIDQAPTCPTGIAEYIGCWDTPGCQQIPASSSGNLRWVIDRIYLSEANEFNIYRSAYGNSSCNGELAFSDYGSTHNFSVTGPNLLANGLMGYQLQVDSNDMNSSLPSYAVFLTATTNNTLCLSNNWDVNDGGFKFNFVEGTEVDMTNCLDQAP